MRSIELFAGIGEIALAAEWAGVETVAFCEREPFCQKVLNKHWPNVPIFDDVKTLNKQALEERGIDVGTIDIISGGFPCQPFSIAGNKKGQDDDRDLWPEMFRIIEEIRPTWVVGENVANFINMELDRTLFNLEGIGYKCQSFIIPACSIQAPHRRDRVFVVGYVSNTDSKGLQRIEQLRNNNEKTEKRGKGTFRHHKDGNPLNNHVSNLEWCTQSKNMKHAYETGLKKTNFHRYKKEILNEYQHDLKTTIKGLARKYNCSGSSIKKLLKENGFKVRPISEAQDKYHIDKESLIIDFNAEVSNKELAKKYKTNSGLIATYRNKHKKGELII